MKKTAVLLLSSSVIFVASVVSVLGQERQQFTFEPQVQAQGEVRLKTQNPDGNTFTYVTSEFSFDKLVKGAPYSAQAVTETTQTLSDGNRIVNSSSTAVYRDGEGRTRREQSLKAIGPFAPSGDAMKTIMIYDPVSGVSYVLDPSNKTARKNQAFHIATGTMRTKAPAGGGESQNFTFTRSPNGDMAMGGGMSGGIMIRTAKDSADFRKEDLGTQTIEGVSAVGWRTTLTIAAGKIGNERQIDIVDERWFSNDLQTVVMTRHSDPRSGEIVYRLTNILRAEPDHSLFEVPTDYTLKDDQRKPFLFETPAKFDAPAKLVP